MIKKSGVKSMYVQGLSEREKEYVFYESSYEI